MGPSQSIELASIADAAQLSTKAWLARCSLNVLTVAELETAKLKSIDHH